MDNSILIYRDPNDVFREFFGGIDPFEEMMDRKFYYCIDLYEFIFYNKQLIIQIMITNCYILQLSILLDNFMVSIANLG